MLPPRTDLDRSHTRTRSLPHTAQTDARKVSPGVDVEANYRTLVEKTESFLSLLFTSVRLLPPYASLSRKPQLHYLTPIIRKRVSTYGVGCFVGRSRSFAARSGSASPR
jgi:hypothetical protein